MLNVSKAEHASPTVMEGGGGATGFLFRAKQVVEFPQVLTSVYS